MTTPLIGRKNEIEQARSILDPSGPHLVVISGSTGVGKTRILDDITASATEFQLVRLYASSAMRHIPFGVLGPVLPLHDLPTDPTLLVSHVHRSLIDSASKPVLLTVDDVHELDQATVGVVHQIVSHGSARVLATVRNPPGLASPLAALAEGDRSMRIDVSPLDRRESHQLLDALLGVAASEQLAEDIWKRTLGVPLYIAVLVRDAVDRGVIGFASQQADALGDLPSDSLHQLVHARMTQAPDRVRRAIEAVAIAGPLPDDVLVNVAGSGHVIQGVRLGLLHRQESTIDVSHPVYAEAVLQHLPPSVRESVAGAVADAWSTLRERPDPIREVVLADLAGRQPEAVTWTRAAMEAVTRLDGQLGEHFARTALQIDPTSFNAALALGRALVIRGRAKEADRTLRDAEPGDATERIARALAHAHVHGFLLGDPDTAIEILAREAEVAPVALRPSLDADRALYAAMRGSFDETIEAGTMVLANPNADGPSQVRASVNVILAKVLLGRFEGIESDFERSYALAESYRHEAPLVLLQTDLSKVNELLLRGRSRESEEWRTRWGTDGESDPRPEWLEWLGVAKAYRGDLEASVSMLRQSLLGFQREDPFRMQPQAVGILAMAEGQMGCISEDLDALLRKAESEAGRDPRLCTWLGRGRAWQAATRGDLDEAASLATSVGETAMQRDHLTWGGLALHDAVRFGRPELVVGQLSELSAATASVDLIDEFAHHAAAMCAGDANELETVAGAFLRFGLVPLAIEVWCHIGRLEQRLGREARATRATTKAEMLLQRAPDLRTPAIAERPDGLTPRESEVIMLAFGELKNREIASRLYISKRTVDNHLSSIYRKLNVEGREGLVAEFSDLRT